MTRRPGRGPGEATADTGALVAASALFHGFSDPSRLAILRRLAQGEQRVVDLTDHLGLAQSTVSKHLACLRDCGLVRSRPRGRASLFSLAHPEATVDLLAAAERLLALTGNAVAICPTYGTSARGGGDGLPGDGLPGDGLPGDDRPGEGR